MTKRKKDNKNNKNNNFINRKQKCYICGCDMESRQIVYDNMQWGGGITYPEKATANVCTNAECGEITFSAHEAQRLQELSREYWKLKK